jgi:hypothetical protein
MGCFPGLNLFFPGAGLSKIFFGAVPAAVLKLKAEKLVSIHSSSP